MIELLQKHASALPGIWAMDTARYLLAAGLVALLLRVLAPTVLKHRKIQVRDANTIRGHAAEFGLVAAKGLDKIEPLLARCWPASPTMTACPL